MSQVSKQFGKWLRLSLIFPLGCLNGWLLLLLISNLQPLFNILLTAILLALLLDYPIRLLQGRGLSRNGSLSLVLLLTVVLLLGLGLTLLPLLTQQLTDLVKQVSAWTQNQESLPLWIRDPESVLRTVERLPPFEWLGIDFRQLTNSDTFSNQVQSFIEQIQNGLSRVASGVLGFLSGTIQNLLNLFITLVLAVFLLIGGETAWQGMLRWLPPWWRARINTHVPQKLRTFMGGQVVIALGFGTVLAVIYTIVGIPQGLLWGFTIGLGSLIPFLGALTQVSVSLFLLFQGLGTGVTVFVVAFIIGQIVDQVISPRVIGTIIGLNPIWVLLSVFIGIQFGGILGALFAVPVASIIKTIADEIISDIEATQPPLEDNTQALDTVQEIITEPHPIQVNTEADQGEVSDSTDASSIPEIKPTESLSTISLDTVDQGTATTSEVVEDKSIVS